MTTPNGLPVIVIDPGHGGSAAVGASSPNNAVGPNGLLEKDVTLDLGRRVASLLADRARVVLTRSDDSNLSLAARARVAADNDAALFASIHLNGFKDAGVDGVEAWVARGANERSKQLARELIDRVRTAAEIADRGVKEADFGVLRSDRHDPETGACLLEVAFLTNPDEARRLAEEDYKARIAQAIADALASQVAVAPLLEAAGREARSLSFTPTSRQIGTLFHAGNPTNSYPDYIQERTWGEVDFLINGRSLHFAGDRTEPFDAMQATVQSTGPGDSVYLAAWRFEPGTSLTGGPYRSANTWGGLLARKAAEGVKIRLLLTDFDQLGAASRTNLRRSLASFDAAVSTQLLPDGTQDNLQYVVSMHPVELGLLRQILAGGNAGTHIGTHHQQFMVVKQGGTTVAFCGSEIERRAVPAGWNNSGLVGWHDVAIKLQGSIARDLEKEFVLRWNLEKDASTVAPSPNTWSGYDTLPMPSPPAVPEALSPTTLDAQLQRTVSSNSSFPTFSAFTTNQDNIKQVYFNLVSNAERYLYFENQCFRSLDLADWIVERGKRNEALVAIFVVMDTPDADDPITQQGRHLQHEFFDRVLNGLPGRAAVYTMTGRAVHSNLVISDDLLMTIGSANANERSFLLDSELNLALSFGTQNVMPEGSTSLTSGMFEFRNRLWAHNLGINASDIASWREVEFIPQWNAKAIMNENMTPPNRHGEGIVRWDYRTAPGRQSDQVPDYLAEFDPDHGDSPDPAGVQIADVGMNGDFDAVAAAAAIALTSPPTPVVETADSTLVRADRVIPADDCGVAKAGGAYRERTPEKVVIHVLQANYADVIASWSAGDSCTPPHYVIRNDGEITQMVAEKYMAQHAGPAGNPTMIGIEHDGWDGDPSYFTEAMYVSSAALVRDICSRYAIPVDREHILGHDEVPGTTHGDPGGYWDWDYYMALVRWDGVDAAWKPQRWVVDATALSGPMATAAWHTVDRDSGRADWRQQRENAGPLYYSAYGPRYVRAQGAPDAPANDGVEFRFVAPQAGSWAVSAWWPVLADASSATQIEISVPTSSDPDQQLQTMVVDQSARQWRTRQTIALPASPTWCPLPMLELQQHDEVRVRVLRRSDAPGRVIADAVRFLKT